MTARADVPRSGFELDHTPLDAARAAFDWLVTGPWPLSVDGRLFAGLPARAVPLDELREVLLHAATPATVRDAVWVHLVGLARGEPRTGRGMWTVGAVGVALPALAAIAAALGKQVAGDRSDVHAAIVAGFVTELTTIDLTRRAVMKRLWWAAKRAGQRAVDEALTAPVPHDPHPDANAASGSSSGTDSSAYASALEPVHTPTADSVDLAFSGCWQQPAGHPDLVLARAVVDGVLTAAEADLIYTTRLENVPLRVIAATRNLSRLALNRVRLRAELRLRTYLTGEASPTDADAGTITAAPPVPATVSDTASGTGCTSHGPSPVAPARAVATATDAAPARTSYGETPSDTAVETSAHDPSAPPGPSPNVTDLRAAPDRITTVSESRNRRCTDISPARNSAAAPVQDTSLTPPPDTAPDSPQQAPQQGVELSSRPSTPSPSQVLSPSTVSPSEVSR